jgi:RNA polymerase sigma-70 factor (ECF subfamily)
MATARSEAAGGRPDAERRHTVPCSFTAIYRRWLNDVCRWATALGGPGIDPDDVAQEVFLVVQRRLPQFEGDDHSSWLYAITTRVVRSTRRRAWLRRTVLGDEGLETLPDPRPAPDEQAQRRQDQRTLYALLGRMSEKRRTVLALCEIAGYTAEEIARLEGIPAATVRSRLFDARRCFLELVAEQRSLDASRRDRHGGGR